MDSRPKSRSQRRRPLREPIGDTEPYNRVYKYNPQNVQEDNSTDETVEVRVKFFIAKDMDTLRWIYCWAGSPVQHCQVYIDGLIHNMDHKQKSHWMVYDLYRGDKPGGVYELAKELIFKVPRSKVDWDKIRAVSEGFKISLLRACLWGVVRHSRGGRDIPKSSPDCVSVSKQILGTLGILASGELPWELYKCLTEAYQPEEESHRSFM